MKAAQIASVERNDIDALFVRHDRNNDVVLADIVFYAVQKDG